MAFFKSTPNLPDNEKARIEFHLQQLADSIGAQRFNLPVLPASFFLDEVQSQGEGDRPLRRIKNSIGEHLNHDVSEVKVQTFPMMPQKVGGGG